MTFGALAFLGSMFGCERLSIRVVASMQQPPRGTKRNRKLSVTDEARLLIQRDLKTDQVRCALKRGHRKLRGLHAWSALLFTLQL
jgi:hypothetical protein